MIEASWPGGAFDPVTHLLYVFSQSTVQANSLVQPDPANSDMRYVAGRGGAAGRGAAGRGTWAGRGGRGGGRGPGGGGRGHGGEGAPGGLTIRGLPLLKPPYGILSAKGEIAWQIAHGETPDNVRDSPELKGLTIPRTGRPGLLGPLLTKTLVIIGEAGFFTTPSGARGAMLRAYDKATGKEVGALYMPAPQSGTPMTYSLDGEQYIVVAISGGSYSGELVAFKLPKG